MSRFERSFWVVTHRDDHDDLESIERAVSEQASSAGEAWDIFLKLHGQLHEARHQGCTRERVKRVWFARGYVARQVVVTARLA